MTGGRKKVPNPFPWNEVMAFGFGVLRLSPRDFWELTPRELNAALEGASGGAAVSPPPTVNELKRLMECYPDRKRS